MQRLPLEALAKSQKARSGIAKKLTIFLALAVVFAMLTNYFFFVRLHEVLVFRGRVCVGRERERERESERERERL